MKGNKPKIMFFLSRIPYPLEKGDKLRAFHLMVQLSHFFDISLCVLSTKPLTEKARKELEKYTVNIHVYQTTPFSIFYNLIMAFFEGLPFQVGYFYNSGAHFYFKEKVEQEQPQHIFVQLLRMAEYVTPFQNISKSIDYMDTFSKGMERRKLNSKNPVKKWIFGLETKRLKKYEASIFSRFQNSYIISEQDKAAFDFENNTMKVLPNGVDGDFFKPKHATEKIYDLLFTGNMSYPPNVDAVVYIVKNILPILHQTNPEIKLYVAGASPSSTVKNLASEQVIISGWLDDIRDAYNSSSIFLAPLQLGTGLQNKLLEAMSMGLPCVTSPLANNALGAQDGTQILLGSTPQEYAQHVLSLMNQKELRERLSINGQLYVSKHYNWEALGKILATDLEG